MKYKYYSGSELVRKTDYLLTEREQHELSVHGCRVVKVNTHSWKSITPTIRRLRLHGRGDFLVKTTKRGTCIWLQGWRQLTIGRVSDLELVKLVRVAAC